MNRYPRSAGKPPRFAERILGWALGADHRDQVLGDLAQEYAERFGGGGTGRGSGWWYRFQVVKSIGPAVALRLQMRRRLSATRPPRSLGEIMANDLRVVLRGLLRNPGFRLKERLVGQIRTPLLLPLASVAVVLLIACVNITNLLLARGTARSSEIAVRAALGAARGRIAALFLIESVVYAVIGGAAGLLLAHLTLDVIAGLDLAAPRMRDVAVDGRVFAVMSAVTLLTGVVAGLVPVWHAARPQNWGALPDRRVAGTGRPQNRLQRVFVAAELAMSTMLVVAAGLFGTSFIKLTNVNPGFQPDNVLTMRLNLPGARYMSNPEEQLAGLDRLLPATH